MTTSVKRILIFLVIFYGLIYFMQNIIGRSIDGISVTQNKGSLMTTEQTKSVMHSQQQSTEKDEEMTPEERYTEAKNNLNHDNIKRKYGITIISRVHGPESVDEWQEFVETNITQSNYFNSPEAQEVVNTMKTSEENFDQQMENIQKEVDKTKSKLAEDPFNKQHKQNLQTMYQLQALSKVLKKRVIVPESAPDPAVLPSL